MELWQIPYTIYSASEYDDGASMKREAQSSTTDLEYTALRSEIVTWIQVEYSLTAVSATMTMIALGFFKATDYWALYSAVLLGLLGAISGLVSFARAKINQTSAYLIIFHDNSWESRMYYLTSDTAFRLTTTLHKVSMFVLFVLLGIAAVAYPYVNSPASSGQYPWFGWIAITVAAIWYLVAFSFWWCSYDKKTQVDYWKKEKATRPRITLAEQSHALEPAVGPVSNGESSPPAQ